jgi:hypothetical protein
MSSGWLVIPNGGKLLEKLLLHVTLHLSLILRQFGLTLLQGRVGTGRKSGIHSGWLHCSPSPAVFWEGRGSPAKFCSSAYTHLSIAQDFPSALFHWSKHNDIKVLQQMCAVFKDEDKPGIIPLAHLQQKGGEVGS